MKGDACNSEKKHVNSQPEMFNPSIRHSFYSYFTESSGEDGFLVNVFEDVLDDGDAGKQLGGDLTWDSAGSSFDDTPNVIEGINTPNLTFEDASNIQQGVFGEVQKDLKNSTDYWKEKHMLNPWAKIFVPSKECKSIPNLETELQDKLSLGSLDTCSLTPQIGLESWENPLNPLATSFTPLDIELSVTSAPSPTGSVSDESDDEDNPQIILKNIKEKQVNFLGPPLEKIGIN